MMMMRKGTTNGSEDICSPHLATSTAKRQTTVVYARGLYAQRTFNPLSLSYNDLALLPTIVGA